MNIFALGPIQVEIDNPAVSGYAEGGAGINDLVSTLIGTATTISGILLTIYLIYGGVMYLSASGDEEQIEKAQKVMTNGALGLIIVVLATSIAAIVGRILNVPILTPPWETLTPRSNLNQ